MKKFGIVIVVLAVCFAMIGLSASADVETQKNQFKWFNFNGKNGKCY